MAWNNLNWPYHNNLFADVQISSFVWGGHIKFYLDKYSKINLNYFVPTTDLSYPSDEGTIKCKLLLESKVVGFR